MDEKQSAAEDKKAPYIELDLTVEGASAQELHYLAEELWHTGDRAAARAAGPEGGLWQAWADECVGAGHQIAAQAEQMHSPGAALSTEAGETDTPS